MKLTERVGCTLYAFTGKAFPDARFDIFFALFDVVQKQNLKKRIGIDIVNIPRILIKPVSFDSVFASMLWQVNNESRLFFFLKKKNEN